MPERANDSAATSRPANTHHHRMRRAHSRKAGGAVKTGNATKATRISVIRRGDFPPGHRWPESEGSAAAVMASSVSSSRLCSVRGGHAAANVWPALRATLAIWLLIALLVAISSGRWVALIALPAAAARNDRSH